MNCEYCSERTWPIDQNDYATNTRRAEAEGWPCCETDANGRLTENARRLRAGQFWDEATKTDRRTHDQRSSETLSPGESR